MKIAVTYENGQIFQHFGHSEQFKLYDIDNGNITNSAVVNTNGSGHGALAGFLQGLKVDVLLCGGIGGGAVTALSQANVRLFAGISGDADKAVNDFLAGKLVSSSDANCDHHGEHHGEDHCCGGHGEHHGEDHCCGGHGERHGEDHCCGGNHK